MKKIITLTLCVSFLFAVSFELNAGDIYSAVFSPDGKKIVVTYSDNSARILDADSGKELQILKHPDGVDYVAFLPDGKKVVTSSNSYGNEIVRLWDVPSGKPLRELKGMFFATSRDGKLIIARDYENHEYNNPIFRILNVDSGKVQTIKVIDELRFDCGAIPFFFPEKAKMVSPDGKKIVTVTGKDSDGSFVGVYRGPCIVQIWDTETGKVLRTFNEQRPGALGGIGGAIFSPDGTKIATQGFFSAAIWDADKGTELFDLKGFAAEFSPDGKIIAVTGGDMKGGGRRDDPVHLWNAETGKRMAELKGDVNLLFSSDGKRIVTKSEFDGVSMWNIQSGEELYGLKNLPVNFSPDGNLFAQSAFDPHSDAVYEVPEPTMIYSAESGDKLVQLEGGFLAFSPDSKKVATAYGNAIRFWIVTGEETPNNTSSTELQQQMQNSVSADENEKTRVKTGQAVKITLSENQTTPYRWVYRISDDKAIRLLHDHYESDPNPRGWTGVGGTHDFYFIAEMPGEYVIEFQDNPIGDGFQADEPGLVFRLSVVADIPAPVTPDKGIDPKLLGKWNYYANHYYLFLDDGRFSYLKHTPATPGVRFDYGSFTMVKGRYTTSNGKVHLTDIVEVNREHIKYKDQSLGYSFKTDAKGEYLLIPQYTLMRADENINYLPSIFEPLQYEKDKEYVLPSDK